MKVSIIIPAYNSADYIKRGLESAINQTYFDIEIIVIDDGSTDETVKIVEKYSEKDARIKLIATDGVFSMDGIIANLKGICDLADKYNALVMVDDSHAVGFVGKNGRGTSEYCGVEGRVDIITS